jgi:hypothetical protein
MFNAQAPQFGGFRAIGRPRSFVSVQDGGLIARECECRRRQFFDQAHAFFKTLDNPRQDFMGGVDVSIFSHFPEPRAIFGFKIGNIRLL